MSERDPSLHVLQHALGLDDYGRGKAYRNHFVTGPLCDNWALCMAHVEAGRMEKHEPREMFGGNGNCCFTVTDAGREYVLVHSPVPPRMSPGKQRYLTWLRVADAYPDLTFGEWLKQRKEPSHG